MLELGWVFFICTPGLEARCVVIKYEWNNCCQLSFYGIISALVLEIAHMKQLTLDDVTILRFQLFVFLKVCKGEVRVLSLHFLMVGVILIVCVIVSMPRSNFKTILCQLLIIKKTHAISCSIPLLDLVLKIIQITLNRFNLLTCPVDVAFMT